MRKRDGERPHKDPFQWPDGHWWIQVLAGIGIVAIFGLIALLAYGPIRQLLAGAPMH